MNDFLLNRRKEKWFPGMWIINGDRVIVSDQTYMCTIANQLWNILGVKDSPYYHLEIE